MSARQMILIAALGFSMFQTATGMAAKPTRDGVAFLGMNASQLNCKKKVAEPQSSAYGESKCPCVGIDNLRGFFGAQVNFHHVQYPLELGAICDSWDGDYHPECKGALAPGWCKQSWCYVDPCNCDLDVTPKKTVMGVQYQGHPAFWSYATCGNFDLFTSDTSTSSCGAHKDAGACSSSPKCGWDGKQCLEKDALATCDQKAMIDETTHGKSSCPCVGFSGRKNGQAAMYINDYDQVAYDANVGGTCGAWEEDSHPDCKKPGPKPSWCSAKWCWVDPCKCTGVVPPKTVMTANGELRFQGKTAYWSYATCGSVDQWTQNTKGTYCVTETTQAGCEKMKKCEWTGTQCLGKALGEICSKQRSSGVLGVEVSTRLPSLRSPFSHSWPCSQQH